MLAQIADIWVAEIWGFSGEYHEISKKLSSWCKRCYQGNLPCFSPHKIEVNAKGYHKRFFLLIALEGVVQFVESKTTICKIVESNCKIATPYNNWIDSKWGVLSYKKRNSNSHRLYFTICQLKTLPFCHGFHTRLEIYFLPNCRTKDFKKRQTRKIFHTNLTCRNNP